MALAKTIALLGLADEFDRWAKVRDGATATVSRNRSNSAFSPLRYFCSTWLCGTRRLPDSSMICSQGKSSQTCGSFRGSLGRPRFGLGFTTSSTSFAMPDCSDDGERFNDVRREEGSAIALNWKGGVCRSGEKLEDDADGGSGI